MSVGFTGRSFAVRYLPFTDAFTVMAAGVAGWHPTPQEEVSMNPSCPTQGLLIAENAG